MTNANTSRTWLSNKTRLVCDIFLQPPKDYLLFYKRLSFCSRTRKRRSSNYGPVLVSLELPWDRLTDVDLVTILSSTFLYWTVNREWATMRGKGRKAKLVSSSVLDCIGAQLIPETTWFVRSSNLQHPSLFNSSLKSGWTWSYHFTSGVVSSSQPNLIAHPLHHEDLSPFSFWLIGHRFRRKLPCEPSKR
jgi:hypothetical protein